MRLFHCDRCGQLVPFSAHRCQACEAVLGYVAEQRTVRVLLPTADSAVYATDDRDPPLWRCLNSAWGCNWMLPAASDTPWCRSCRLTRGRPDETNPDAVDAWGRLVEPIGVVVDKLAFVHRQVGAHTERHRFYATH